MGCFWRKNCRRINKVVIIRLFLSCICFFIVFIVVFVNKLFRYRSIGYVSCKEKLRIRCKEGEVICILGEE